MSDLAPFVASVLRDKVISELLDQNEKLRHQMTLSGILQITGRDGYPVYAEASLNEGNITLSDPTFFYVYLESKQLAECTLSQLKDVEFYLGGIYVGGFATAGDVTGVHLDPYNPKYRVWNLYCDRMAAITVGIKNWDDTSWSNFVGDTNPRDLMRSLQAIVNTSATPVGQQQPHQLQLAGNNSDGITVAFVGINLPILNIENSPYMMDVLAREKRLMDKAKQRGIVHITGRYGSPVYAEGFLASGMFHSADSNVWYVGFDESKQLLSCQLSNLTAVEVYVGGTRFGRFDGEVNAENMDPHNVHCQIYDLHPCDLCVATVAVYNNNNNKKKRRQKKNVDQMMMTDYDLHHHTHNDGSLVELSSILAEENRPDDKRVVFQGISLPVKHIRSGLSSFPCMSGILQQNESMLRQQSGVVRVTGRHGQPVYAEAVLYSDGVLCRSNGYSECMQIDFWDDFGGDGSSSSSTPPSTTSCPLANLSGVEISVAGNVTAAFDREVVFAHLMHNSKGQVWELSCDGIAGATIKLEGSGSSNDKNWSVEECLIKQFGSTDPREIGIVDLSQLLSIVDEHSAGNNVSISFVSIKLRVDGLLKRLLRQYGLSSTVR